MIVKDPLIVNPLPSPLTVSFLAPASNTGRTSIVTNLAWLYARHGRDTFVLDLSTEGAAVHDYLGPFLSEELAAEQVLGVGAEDLLVAIGDQGATVRRYSVGVGRLDVIRTGAFSAEVAGPLHDALRDTSYDYVLVDASTDNSRPALAGVAAFSDRVAVCLNPQSSNVRDAARLVDRLFDIRPDALPMVLVASDFGGDPKQEERSRAEIRREFRALGAGGPISLQALPPQPYYDYLALLKEPAGSALRRAYAALARMLVPEDLMAHTDVPASLSNRYVMSMDVKAGPGRPDHPYDRVTVIYHPAEQLWLEWLSRQLEANGIEVALRQATQNGPRHGGGPLVVMASPAYDAAACLDQTLSTGSAGAAEPELVMVALPNAVLPAAAPPYAVVDLTHKPTWEVATDRLFGALGMTGVGHVVGEGSRRLFAEPKFVNLVPPRDLPFLGRDHEIGALRDALARAEHQVVVQAESGMGKTALVREYYERFGADYDTVWWIPAHDARAVRRSLTQLGERLVVRPRGDVVAATLDVLALTDPPADASAPGQWLLVYDGVRDLTHLEGLLPAGGRGHVVITTQSPDHPAVGGVLPLGPLEHKNVVDGLTKLVDIKTHHQAALSEEDAGDLVDAVEAAPVGVRLVCTYLSRVLDGPAFQMWLTGEVMGREDLLRDTITAVRDATATDGLGGLLELVLELLHRDLYGARARHLAEMCAFLSPAGVDLRLLRAPTMLAQFPSADDRPFTFDDIDRAIWTGASIGLFSVRWPDLEPLRTVPALQRMLLDRMTGDERAERRQQVRRGLAGVANALLRDADTRMRTAEAKWTAAIYGELQRHVTACAALDDDEPATREWLVRQFRYLVRTADQTNLRYAEPLLAALFERWYAAYPTDLLTLRLANERTNVLRGLGRYQAALALDERMLREFIGLLGRDHFRILVLRRGIAADQRALGQFRQALALDQATWRFFADTHGLEHPETLTAGHNLAVSQALAGQLAVALETERQVHRGRSRLLGDTGRQTLWSEMEIGIYTRELGDFTQAVSLLLLADRRMQEAGLARQHALRLRARRHWAVAHRLAGSVAESRGTLGPILQAYEDLFGPDHPQSWATRLSFAAEEHDAGHFDQAVDLAGRVLDHYESHLGEHPFTAGARANLAVYLLGVGREVDAATHARRAHEELLRLLGEPHPWSIGALLGRVLVEASQQSYETASELAAEAYDLALEYLPQQEGMPRHPCVLIATEWQRLLSERHTVDAQLGWPPGRRRHLEITIPET